MAHSKGVHQYKHALEVEKHREHLIREAMKERMEAEKASHAAQHHQLKSQRLAHNVRNVGRTMSIVGYIVILAILAGAFYMIAHSKHWFGL